MSEVVKPVAAYTPCECRPGLSELELCWKQPWQSTPFWKKLRVWDMGPGSQEAPDQSRWQRRGLEETLGQEEVREVTFLALEKARR